MQVFAIIALFLEFIPAARRRELSKNCKLRAIWLAPRPDLFRSIVRADWTLAIGLVRCVCLGPFREENDMRYCLRKRYGVGDHRSDKPLVVYRYELYVEPITYPIMFVLGILTLFIVIPVVLEVFPVMFTDKTFYQTFIISSDGEPVYQRVIYAGIVWCAILFRWTIVHAVIFILALPSPLWLVLASLLAILVVYPAGAALSARHYTRVVTGMLLVSGSAAFFLSLLTS